MIFWLLNRSQALGIPGLSNGALSQLQEERDGDRWSEYRGVGL